MEKSYETLFDAIENGKSAVLEAERYIWNNPETGYNEWKTHAYLKAEFEKLGCVLHEAGNIPGFYTDIDTGKDGPTVAIFGELDSLSISAHPECDKQTGAVHACGHNCQSAALLGVAIGLTAPHALDGLCGKIRLIAVPAEEAIELDERRKLRDEGVIHYTAGKQEFMYRGFLDDVDVAMVVHASASTLYKFGCNAGSNGCILKDATFTGKSAHAGALPYRGVNALYAAHTAIAAANALRETFKDSDSLRFHPIVSRGGEVVNTIPDDVGIESYIRGANMAALTDANDKLNRAFAGAAASIGCKLHLHDEHGMAPRYNDKNLKDAFYKISSMFFDEKALNFNEEIGGGCSDMGDINTVIPSIHPWCAGASGTSHSSNYRITDPENACVTSAKIQAGVVRYLLQNDAAYAKKVIDEKQVVYPSIKAYFEAIDKINADFDAVKYGENGTVYINYKK